MESICHNQSKTVKLEQEDIDADHRNTLETIGYMQKLLDSKPSKPEKLKAAFDGLLEHSRNHFVREEEFMKKYGFPIYTLHENEHKRMSNWFTEQRQLLEEKGPEAIRHFIEDELPNFIMEHIYIMDATAVNYICQVTASEVSK